MKTKYIDRGGHTRWPKQLRQELTEQFLKTEITQKEFAQKHDIHPKTLSRWIREARKVSAAPVAFQQVLISSAVGLVEREVQVLLPNQVRLLVPAASMQELGNLIREAAKC